MASKPTYEELALRVAELESQVGPANELGISNQVLSALLKAFHHIPLCKTFEDAAKEIFAQCKRLTGARSGYVALLSENGEENEVLFLDAGGMPCDVDPDLPMPIRGLREVAYRTKAVVYDNDFAESPWMAFMPRGHVKLDNVLFAPLNIEQSTVGIIGIANKPGGFNEKDVHTATIMGDLAAIALNYAKAQDALRERKERLLQKDKFLQAIYNDISHSIFVVDVLADKEFRYAGINPQHEALTGIANDDIRGKTPLDVLPEDAALAVIDHYRDCVQANQPITYEEWLPFKGKPTCWETTLHPQVSETGQAYRIIGTSHEITKRKQMEVALRESEEKHRTMMESMDESVYICSAAFRIEYMNPAMIKKIGRDATNELCYQAIHGLAEQCPWCNHSKVMGGETLKAELTKSETQEVFFVSQSPIYHTNGSVSKLTIYRDITAQKRLEQRVQQAQRMESIGTLAGGIAHDFNNILFPIMGMSEMLLEDLTPGSLAYDNADEIYQAGKRGRDLVTQILAFSRQSENKRIPVGIQKIMREVLKLSRSSIPANIEISQCIQNDCGLVMADPTQIHQVAMNLITNAYHAVEQTGGRISVELREVELKPDDLNVSTLKPGRYIRLAVSDTGHGIDPAIMDKIFDPYFTTKKKGKGTGLGLATVHGIVKDHNGDVLVASELNQGTTFSVLLPVFKQRSAKDDVSVDVSFPTGTERILLVDDEEAIMRLERLMLERLGYHVTPRVNSIEALEAFKADPGRFDLVISDLTMPNLTGDRLAEKLLAIRSDIPIIMCTGFSERMNADEAKKMGIQGFLLKPVVKSEMARMVSNVLETSKGQDS